MLFEFGKCAVYLIYVHADFGHETVHSTTSAQCYPAPALDRTVEQGTGDGVQINAHLRFRRLWQDHAGQRMGCQLRETNCVAIAG